MFIRKNVWFFIPTVYSTIYPSEIGAVIIKTYKPMCITKNIWFLIQNINYKVMVLPICDVNYFYEVLRLVLWGHISHWHILLPDVNNSPVKFTVHVYRIRENVLEINKLSGVIWSKNVHTQWYGSAGPASDLHVFILKNEILNLDVISNKIFSKHLYTWSLSTYTTVICWISHKLQM